ncbi:MAG: sigma-70 family RNA polymerase sigma factor [Deltaproteobacteria bacterium]|nr:sigma-70 family RNA polymerase sigma factor [Deltaproteobacteria bacterium]
MKRSPEDWEQDCIAESRNGRPDRFRPLVATYAPKVRAICLRMVGNWHAAEDLAQQSLVDAFFKLNQFHIDRPFWPWLCRITVNNCKDYLKSKKRTEIPSVQTFDQEAALFFHAHEDPQQAAEHGERRAVLERALAELPEHYRIVVVLKDIEGLSYDEIQSVLDLPVTTLKIRAVRARRKLAARLRAESPGQSDRDERNEHKPLRHRTGSKGIVP